MNSLAVLLKKLPSRFMKQLGKVARSDWKFIKAEADPDFDPEHNKRVIEESIKKHDAKVKAIMREHNNQVGERVEAATSYLKNLERGSGESNVEKYFGTKILEKLQAQNPNLRMRALQNVKAQS